eukprot:4937212-Pleurochrysis_carterae.AAC.2
MPPGRNSAARLRVAAAIAVKAADSRRPTSKPPAASSRMRAMSRASRRARAVSFSSHTPSTMSSSVPSITAAGEAAACSKQHVEGVCVGADRAQQLLERGVADEGQRAHRCHNAIAVKAGEDCIAQLPSSLGAK